MRTSASRWTVGMALAPAVVALVGFLVMSVDRVLTLPHVVATVANHTALAVMLGGIVLAPGIACAVAAANMVEHGHRSGRRIGLIGLSLLAAGNTVIVGVILGFSSAHPIVAVPFVAMILGDLYAITKVRRTS